MSETIELSPNDAANLVGQNLNEVTTSGQITTDFKTGNKQLVISIAGSKAMSNEDISKVSEVLKKQYPEQEFELVKTNNVSPEIVYTSLDDPYIISMVEYGLGKSILSELVLLNRDFGVKTLPLYPEASRELGIAVYSRNRKKPEINAFIDAACNFLNTKQDDPACYSK